MDISLLVQEGFKVLVTRLTDKAISAGFKALIKDPKAKSQLDFSEHLERTFDRCTKIRTLLNRDKPIELLSQYTNLIFRSDGENIDDYDLIEKIPSLKHVVISGTAGGGKTVFMRYYWIAGFVRSPGNRIPLYIELRKLNNFTTDDLFSYIFHSTFPEAKSSKAREAFDQAIKDGRFVFILDGFDEVQDEQKSSIERQILHIAHHNPDNIFVVSGRPDERFGSWQSFTHFRVLPLSNGQVKELINKVEFDQSTKKKFISRLDSDLYERHESFLSTPLLATMMLLTFDSYADIPEKIHVFYDQAFTTLFARHDATKENFKRTIKSGLAIDGFQAHFANFSLTTYLKQKYEFTEAETLEELKLANRLGQTTIDEKKFLIDLRDAVCMLALDGTKLVFNHRSFQEYFAAYCALRLPPAKAKLVIRKIASRHWDSAFQMMFDMNQSLVEEYYILPFLDEIIVPAKVFARKFDLEKFLSSMKINLTMYRASRYERNNKKELFRWNALFSDNQGVVDFLVRFEDLCGESLSSREASKLRKVWTAVPPCPIADQLLEKIHAKAGNDETNEVVVYMDGNWKISHHDVLEIKKWVQESFDHHLILRRFKFIVKHFDKFKTRVAERDKSLNQVLDALIS